MENILPRKPDLIVQFLFISIQVMARSDTYLVVSVKYMESVVDGGKSAISASLTLNIIGW